MKLTPLQSTTLAAIRGGKVEQKNFGTGAWRIVGANPSVVGKLISMGLAKWPNGICSPGPALLTDAGKAEAAS